ncbi:MAG: hypothetical protein WCF92_01515 [bacterium]
MSNWITFRQIDKKKVEEILNSIFDGSYQKKQAARLLELKAEIEKTPELAEIDTYLDDLFATKEKVSGEDKAKIKKSLLDESVKITQVLEAIKSVNETKWAEDKTKFDESVKKIINSIVFATGKNFDENLNDIIPYVNLLFKHSGLTFDKYQDMSKLDFSTWESVFKNLSKDILLKIKNEQEVTRKREWPAKSFETFISIIKDIKNVFVGCDGKEVLFSVTIEGKEENSEYIKSLEQKIKDYVKNNAFALV